MKTNQLKAGVILSYISIFASAVISVAYTPVMLKLLGKSEYGLYNLAASIASWLGLLSFGFGSAFMRYYSRCKANVDYEGICRLNGIFMSVFLFIGAAALFAGFILILNVEFIFKGGLTTEEIGKVKVLMAIMTFNIAVSFPASVFDSNIMANERYLFQKIVSLAKTVLSPFLTLPLLFLGYKSVAMAAMSTVLTLGSLWINMWYCFKKLNVRFIFYGFDIGLLKEIWIFSFYIFINMIVDQINWNVDKFILGIYKGTAAVAVYSIGAQFNTYYLLFSTSISSVFIPRVNKMIAEHSTNEEITRLFVKVGRMQFVVLSFIIIGFIIFGRYFIKIWAGEDYASSYYVALLLMLPTTIPAIQNLGLEIQKAKNMHKFRSIIYMAIAIINVCVSIPLGRLFGEIGCAAGTAVALFLGNAIAMNWYYQRKIGIDIRYFWKKIAKFSFSLIPPVAFGIIAENMLTSIGRWLFLGVIYFLLFASSIYFLGMNKDERNLFVTPLAKIKLQKKP
ncbi:MAG: oligosaccharide flippase family protein [Clostridia bacterium]|nr:oligosaccharide flippase family protein [Clostridia bacterium]